MILLLLLLLLIEALLDFVDADEPGDCRVDDFDDFDEEEEEEEDSARISEALATQ